MRRTYLPAAAAFCLVAACQPQPLSQADQDAVKAADAAIITAINAGNVDGAAAGYAADAVLQGAGMAPATGTAAIHKMYADFLGPMKVRLTLSQVAVSGEGNVAWITGRFHGVYTMKDSTQASPPPEDGKYLQVWMRQADKSWKAVAEAFSSNSMPAPPAPARPAHRS